jgi:hypothetical protein
MKGTKSLLGSSYTYLRSASSRHHFYSPKQLNAFLFGNDEGEPVIANQFEEVKNEILSSRQHNS